MTVPAETNLFREFVADGLGTEHTLPYPLRLTSDLRVEADGVAQVMGTHYSVSGAYPSQKIVPIAPYWAAGTVISYYRVTERKQEYDIPPGVELRAESLEDELDRVQLQQQEQDYEIARAAKVARGETPPTIGELVPGEAVVVDADGKIVSAPSDIAATEIVQELAAQVAEDAGDVADARIEVLAAVDGLTDAIPVYATPTAALAALADGDQFLIAPTQGNLFPLFVRLDADNAEHIGWRAPSSSGQAVLARVAEMRSRANRPQYEWFFGNAYDGRFVVNTGTYGDLAPEPHVGQLMGGASCVFDQDGATNGVRNVWPSGLVNTLGFNEIVSFEFDTSGRSLILWYNQDLNDGPQPTVDLRAYVSIRRKAGEATNEPLYIGLDGRGGTPTDFTLDDTFTLRTVDLDGYVNGTTASIVIEPNTTSTPTYPQKFEIEYAGVTLGGVKPPSLATLRNQYRAGHAMPAYALGNASLTDNAFLPTNAVPNMLANLRRDEVQSAWFTFYTDMNEDEFDGDEAHVMAYGREDRNDTDQASLGGMKLGGGTPLDVALGNNEYAGRLIPTIGGDSNQGITTPSDTHLWGAGLIRWDVVVAGKGEESRQNNGQRSSDADQRFAVFMDAAPQTEYPVVPYPAGTDPRIMYLAAYDTNTSKAFMPKPGRNIRSPLLLARYRVNIDDVPTVDEIMEEIAFDEAECGIVLPPVEFAVGVLGDSTSRFSGNAHHTNAYYLRGQARRFTNLSQGGMYYEPGYTGTSTSRFNSAGQIEIRSDYFRVNKFLGTKRGIFLSHGGENNPNHIGDDPAQALADYAALAPAEAAEHCPGVFIHAICTVRPSGVGGLAGRDDKDAFNAYLRSVFTEQVDAGNPYLWRDPAYDGTGFKYMIDVDAWAPRHPDHGLSYTSWDDLLINDTGPGKSNKVLAGDYQHPGGSFGFKYMSVDVFVPSYELIALEEWDYTL